MGIGKLGRNTNNLFLIPRKLSIDGLHLAYKAFDCLRATHKYFGKVMQFDGLNLTENIVASSKVKSKTS